MMSIVGIKSLAIPREQQAAHCLPVLFDRIKEQGGWSGDANLLYDEPDEHHRAVEASNMEFAVSAMTAPMVPPQLHFPVTVVAARRGATSVIENMAARARASSGMARGMREAMAPRAAAPRKAG